MTIRVSLSHKTCYHFDRPVNLSPHVVRLRPAPHCRTPIQAYSIKVNPGKHFINWQQDPFGNYLARLVFPDKTSRLSIDVSVVADMTVINPFDFFLETEAEEFPFRYCEQQRRELIPYLEMREDGPLLCNFVERVDLRKRRTIDFLVDLNQSVQSYIGYLIRMEPGVQTCEETLQRRSGSCRDSGWLLVQVLRHLGLAARFVSGYIVQLVPDVKPLEGPAGATKDFIDLHAWAEVYLPGAGWVGLDPTSGLFAGEGHLPLACTPDPISAAPVTGLTDKCESEMHVDMTLTRVHEDPRVTKPYTEADWNRIMDLGARIDGDLFDSDVRLTMGGEPTFVSIDDMDGPEWNIAANSIKKHHLAVNLLHRVRERFAPYGVLHHGQGKWYPGEELPRWALSLYWRKDGVPIWQAPALLAHDATPGSFTRQDAAEFLESLAPRLGVDPRFVTPGFEDVYYYLWREGTLPVNFDPHHSDLSSSMERKRLRELLDKGLEKETGYVLPLRWRTYGGGGWESGAWQVRRERLYLIPGDSSMGYRLPLDSLAWIPPSKRPPDPARSQFEPRPSLGDFYEKVARRQSQWTEQQAIKGGGASRETKNPDPPTGTKEKVYAPGELVSTALCIEPRHGRLYIFLPPLSHIEHYLDLIAAIEATAEELQMPVVLEGYPPPYDWRVRSLQITPDPGVIEVNVYPCGDWDELVELNLMLHDEARLARLGTEKFMLDGRHTGTGGGNHVTLGGITPADSPMLRRPDLLQSLITYWQHHPSLSYLFAGSFIGPTSQMPRIDEARHDTLYEMEIAFQQMPNGGAPFPWVVDRLLRHLLVDITGNTHRAEFCIDKLHSPDSMTGRLGILELRSLEMPPHPRMALVQLLLIRGLIARFWHEPYSHDLVRWGTELHDRFLLPHYLWRDFQDIISGLRNHGYPFDEKWFAPFFEFRFPHYGAVTIDDMEMELRMAVEPWHVLGEEVAVQGTSRYVDSSVERLQVKVTGMVGSRHVVTCNGRRVPLRNTGTNGEYVAAVRYRAWEAPSALHPTIGLHTPLIFDIVDTWNHCSIGGCRYHVAHPGGRSYDTFPVNAYEAEARRIARFWPFGHSSQRIEAPPERIHPEFPHTLDLRRENG